MDVPILINGRETGRLDIRNEGIYTLFSARSEDPGTLVRLAVYGDGGYGVLGVMLPCDGVLTLRKKLSRAAIRDFPEVIRYAAPEGERAKNEEPAVQEAKSDLPTIEEPELEETEDAPCGELHAKKECERFVPEETEKAEEREEEDDASGGEGTELIWYEAGDGSLYTVWESREFRAIPMTAYGLPESRMLEKRVIGGIDYAVFETREGKIF